MTTQLHTLIRLRKYEFDRCQLQLSVVLQEKQTLADRLNELDHQANLHRTQLSALSGSRCLNVNAIQLRQQHLEQLASQHCELNAEFEAMQAEVEQHRKWLLAADQRLQVAEELSARSLAKTRIRCERQQERDIEAAMHAKLHSSR